MRSRGLPLIYERLWRPVGVRLFTGPSGAIENQVTDEYLELHRGDVVLDLACGPGNITRRLAAAVGVAGHVVGADASATMLARSLPQYLNRVRNRGESFVVQRGGEIVCRIVPIGPARCTVADLVCVLESAPMPDRGFLDAVERVNRRQPKLPKPPSGR